MITSESMEISFHDAFPLLNELVIATLSASSSIVYVAESQKNSMAKRLNK